MSQLRTEEKRLIHEYARVMYDNEIGRILASVSQAREKGRPTHELEAQYDMAWTMFTEASIKTRVMYLATDLDEIPDGAQMIAYYPYGRAGSIERFEYARWVPLDHTGDHPRDCAGIDMVGHELSLSTVAEWLRIFGSYHSRGLGTNNAHFDKPIVRITVDMVPKPRSHVGMTGYDLWVVHYDKPYTRQFGEVVREVLSFGPKGKRYQTCLVYDSTFGAHAPAKTWDMDGTVNPQPLKGTVGWLSPEMNSRFAHVESHDGGQTWQTRP